MVRRGYCLFCLGEKLLPATKRFQSWTRGHKLRIHIAEHTKALQRPAGCPHPLCDDLLGDKAALQSHLTDERGLSRSCASNDKPEEAADLDHTSSARQRRASSATHELDFHTNLIIGSPAHPPWKIRAASAEDSTISPNLLSSFPSDNKLAVHLPTPHLEEVDCDD